MSAPRREFVRRRGEERDCDHVFRENGTNAHTDAEAFMIARVAAVASLAIAIVVIVVVLLGGGSTYTLHADFTDAGGLVTGDDVLMGPAKVGQVQSISLTPNGEAEITMAIDSVAGPLHEGTVARIYENSLSGIATRYVVLEPAPSEAPEIPDG